MTVLGVALATAVAFADSVTNTLDGTIDSTVEVMPLTAGGAAGTTQLYVSPANGDGKNGCNLTGSTTLTLSLSSSDAKVATVSPSSVTFTSCDKDIKTLTVTPVGAGTATISATQTANTTGGTFDLAPATFKVNVTAAANTPPNVSVTGVAAAGSYAKGAVPTATCQVTDAEDGPSSFAATLSAVTGPYAADGIGAQTASCSYTDKGGLTASGSETYSIVDPSAPAIAATRTPADPDGLNGWYTSDVSLGWDVSEPQSPTSLVKDGCVDRSITADQNATTYTCSATSAGGSTGPVSVTIKRDGTKPTIGGAATPAANTAGWNNGDVHVGFDCSDNLSGVDACGPGATLTHEGRGQSVTGTATDKAGNASDPATVGGINIDTSAPNAPSVSADRAPDYAGDGGWYKDRVTVSFAGAGDPALANGDDGSGVDPATVPADATFTTSGAHTASGTVKDRAENESGAASLSVKVDADAPVLTATCPSAPVLKGSKADATWSATDGESGPKTASGTSPLNTDTVGTQTKTVPAGTAEDNVGHGSAAATCTYRVVYDFSGFFQPIDNKDAAGNYILNKAKAGSAIPVKFSLAGNQGLGILAGTPQTSSVPCGASASDAVEEYATVATSGLKYDATANQYVYNWKTESSWTGTCRQLIVTLADGTSHRANFTFVK